MSQNEQIPIGGSADQVICRSQKNGLVVIVQVGHRLASSSCRRDHQLVNPLYCNRASRLCTCKQEGGDQRSNFSYNLLCTLMNISSWFFFGWNHFCYGNCRCVLHCSLCYCLLARAMTQCDVVLL
mmetsp:Transcript_12244/g.18455  ORF Transcript_12244/g.18455 Transcript_12244/m.18455 type:complete len:125 (-) Transcript_12244:35-409(-)